MGFSWLEQPLSTKNYRFGFDCDIIKFTLTVNQWLQSFVIEVRKMSGEHYCSLHQICCGLQRALRATDQVDVKFFESSEFASFRDVLDGDLKWLNATGKYVHKKKAKVCNHRQGRREDGRGPGQIQKAGPII